MQFALRERLCVCRGVRRVRSSSNFLFGGEDGTVRTGELRHSFRLPGGTHDTLGGSNSSSSSSSTLGPHLEALYRVMVTCLSTLGIEMWAMGAVSLPVRDQKKGLSTVRVTGLSSSLLGEGWKQCPY